MKLPRKGWFKIPGVQDGDRTLEQQLKGLGPAIAEVKGKRVLDLGAAECLISRHMIEQGASFVRAIEVVPDAAAEGERQCKGLNVQIQCADLADLAPAELADGIEASFDVVIALAILHKFKKPTTVAKFMLAHCRDLCVIRYPGMCPNGVIIDARADYKPFEIPKFMTERGFVNERNERGPLGEVTAYWRKHGDR